MEAGFNSHIGGDVPDWDNTERNQSGEDGAWRDLIARFDEPLTSAEAAPWPEREDVSAPPAPPSHSHSTGEAQAADRPDELWDPLAGEAVRSPRGPEGRQGFDDEAIRRALAGEGTPGAQEPDVIEASRRNRHAAERRIRARRPPAPEVAQDDEHYVPPEPPPLPTLDPITKGAWLALFGGPGYLVVATAAGWSVPGYAAFCAVAAFVTGFALLVLRMNEPGPGGPDDGDDGAVV